MAIVLDANLPIVMVSGDPRRERVLTQMTQWLQQNTPLHAPHLLPYEVVNALTRSIVAGQFSEEDLAPALESLRNLPIIYHPVSYDPRVVEIALSLRRQSAYDAAYIALAESLNAELWTLDSPLYRNATGLGFPVRLIATD